MLVAISKPTLRSILWLMIAFLAVIVLSNITSESSSKPVPEITQENCVPAFLDGGGPYYIENVEFRDNLAPAEHTGEVLTVEGYLFNTNCTETIPGAIVDIWQASEEGEYEDEYYRGKVRTDEDGYYRFSSVVPLGYGEGTAYRPPIYISRCL